MAVAREMALERRRPPVALWSSGVLLLITGLVLADGFWPARWLGVLMTAGLLCFLALEWPRLPTVARVLIGLAMAAALLSLGLLPDAPRIWLEGLEKASFYTAFFVALGFLREPAERSALVRRCGALMVNQPPGRRYAALATGGVLFGTILNLGAVNLLGTMIRRGNTLAAAAGRPEIVQARLRRMGLALLRGFSVTPMASPLSIAFIVVVSTVPGASWPGVLVLGVLTGVLVLLLGWLMDWLVRPHHLAHMLPPRVPLKAGWEIVRFTALVMAIFGLAAGIELTSPLSLPESLLLAAPGVGVAWILWQLRRYGPLTAARLTAARLRRRGPALLSGLRGEISIISSASFIGVVVAAMLPGEAVADWLRMLGAGDTVIVLAVGPLVALLSLAGINPILPVVVLATAIGAGGVYGGPPELLALGFMVGWTTAINISPMIPALLAVSRIIQVPAVTLSLGWNWAFSLGLVVLGGCWLWLLGLVL